MSNGGGPLAPTASYSPTRNLGFRRTETCFTMSCMKTYRAESARAGLDALSRAGRGYDEFVNTAIELIEMAVPWDGICVGTMDPATVMMTRAFKTDITNDPGADHDFLHHEYASDDFSQFADLARREVGASILRTETGGDPQRSARFTEVVRPLLGAEHELRGVARADAATWGRSRSTASAASVAPADSPRMKPSSSIRSVSSWPSACARAW